MLELFPLYAAIFIVVFLPIWIFLDWIIKKYNFQNRIFNAIFSSPLNVMLSAFVLTHSLWKYEFFINKDSAIDTPQEIISLFIAVAIFAVMIYMYISCKYAYKPTWFKNKFIK